jgi:succinate-acetate transporter protein
MAEVETKVVLKDTIGNPAPLGLMAFGMTTVLLNLHNAGLFGLSTMILAMGVFYGGIAQIIAGVMEFRKNNAFGATAFCSYGLFWLTLVALIVFPKWTGVDPVSTTGFGWYLLAWGVFTGLMFVATLKLNRSLQTVFLSLTILFVLLAIREWTGGAESTETFLGMTGHTWGRIAGWEGIFVGLSAMYGSIAQIWNEAYGRVVLPIGPAKK